MSRSGRRLLAGAGILFLFTCLLAWRGSPFLWEMQLSGWIYRVQEPVVGWILRAVSWIGSGYLPFLMVPILALFLWKTGLVLQCWVLLAGVGGASLANLVLKHLIDRPRPGGMLFPAHTNPGSPGLPSGHVVLFVACFGYLLLLARRHWSGFLRTVVTGGLGFLILAVGISRVWLGAHWPLDCIGGYLLGALMVGAMLRRSGDTL